MDILYFLRRRTAFARSFYERASRPFVTVQRQIERQEPPFDNPPFDESGEPAYLAEWQEAEEGIEMLGQMCLTFLSNSLKLYLDETTHKLSRILGDDFNHLLKGHHQRGFQKYEHLFGRLGIPFEHSPVDLALIREIVETRNLIQHPESIALLHAHQDAHARERFPRPFFAHPIEKAVADREPNFTPDILWISSTSLSRALDAVDAFCDWVEVELWATTRVGVVTNYFKKCEVAAVRIPDQIDHRFRSKSITDSDPSRSLIPTEIDHRRRSESIARHRS